MTVWDAVGENRALNDCITKHGHREGCPEAVQCTNQPIPGAYSKPS